MITVKEAKDIVLQHTQNYGTEEIPFLESVGRVLKEDIVADRDFPPFNRVSMDGIAINYRFFEYGVRDFKIEGIQAAGTPQETMENAAHCYEVMTGAILPANTDTVIRYEDIKINTLMATTNVTKIKEGQNVHLKGFDQKAQDVLITKNKVISSADIAILASVGKSTVTVAKQPKILIISTGDELVAVNQTPKEHQIRKSNTHALTALLKQLQIPTQTVHLNDNKEVLLKQLKEHLTNFDVLLCSGAVSKGKFDFLPEVFEELGVKKEFHKVAQRPGKPFWFGTTNTTTSKKTIIFAFPGNPVSAFANCLYYFYPWYKKSTNYPTPSKTAILNNNVIFKPNLTYLLQVELKTENNTLIATPIPSNGSGDLVSLSKANAFIVLPQSTETIFEKGNSFPVIQF